MVFSHFLPSTVGRKSVGSFVINVIETTTFHAASYDVGVFTPGLDPGRKCDKKEAYRRANFCSMVEGWSGALSPSAHRPALAATMAARFGRNPDR